ncbi:uncharacterized protein LOC123539269 isoform X2 [Mercenaria mercenaria]|uniref:uncharacterized protein LOC123539269 isoform X2 n=1 Tax=Mercenaria mercenaria TaxID=6596 RepID=UPI00234EBB87|nr:uncharacterized protein LOC123539269 isoform X2 [Mercenaria mercenaria]
MSLDFHLPPIQIPPVQPPVVLTDPYRGSHVLRWNKSRGQPDSSRLTQTMTRESSFNLSIDDDDMNSTCTPYRLPRLSPRLGDQSPNSDTDNSHDDSKSNDKVWSRYGYEKIIRIPELSPQIRMLVPPPKSYASPSPYQTPAPRFKNAAITPTARSVPWHLGRDIDDSHLQLYQSNHSRVHDEDYSSRQTRLEPTPTPISRSESPAKSVKSIHWILGHNRYHTFDKKGRSHIQGPYSREFNVTCMPPNNWLKMKWGRSKTIIH